MSATTIARKRARRTQRRHRIRGKVSGTAERPRLSVYRSNRGVFAQLIDDDSGRTVAAVSWVEADIKGLKPMEQAKRAGELLATRARRGRGQDLRVRPRRLQVPRPRQGAGRRGPRSGAQRSRDPSQ